MTATSGRICSSACSVERVEPQLGVGVPTILYEYPLSMAALARAKPGTIRASPNGSSFMSAGSNSPTRFGELTDPVEQRARFIADHGREAAPLRQRLSDRRGFPRRARPDAGERAASRSASTAWSCWRAGAQRSIRCSGRRWRNNVEAGGAVVALKVKRFARCANCARRVRRRRARRRP